MSDVLFHGRLGVHAARPLIILLLQQMPPTCFQDTHRDLGESDGMIRDGSRRSSGRRHLFPGFGKASHSPFAATWPKNGDFAETCDRAREFLDHLPPLAASSRSGYSKSHRPVIILYQTGFASWSSLKLRLRRLPVVFGTKLPRRRSTCKFTQAGPQPSLELSHHSHLSSSFTCRPSSRSCVVVLWTVAPKPVSFGVRCAAIPQIGPSLLLELGTQCFRPRAGWQARKRVT